MTDIITQLQNYFHFNIHGILNVLIGVLNLAIGIVTLMSDPKSKENRDCFAFTLSSFIWVLGFGMMSLVRDVEAARPWLSFSYVFGVPFIPVNIYIFSWHLLKREKKNFLIPIGFVSATLLMIPMTFFNREIFNIESFSWGNYSVLKHQQSSYIYYFLLLAHFYFYSLLSLRALYIGWKSARSPGEKTQSRNFLIGILIAYTGSIDFFISYGFKIYAWGYVSLTVFTVMIFYNILRHHFLDVNLALKKFTLIFLIYLFLILFISPIILFFSGKIMQSQQNPFFIIFGFSVLFGGLFSTGPLIYANLVRNSYWLRGHLTTGLTHELKSPLSLIQSAADVLFSDVTKPEFDRVKVIEYLSIIQNNAARLQSFVSDLLNVAKTEKDPITLNKTVFDLNEVVTDMCAYYQTLASRKNLKIEVETPGEVLMEADKPKIQQVLSNLLSNAVKFSDKGTIRVDLQKSANEIHLSVQDEGPGVSPAHLNKIFDKFFQASPNTQGTGIGLTIAKAWVEAHGGRIWASQNEGSIGLILHVFFRV